WVYGSGSKHQGGRYQKGQRVGGIFHSDTTRAFCWEMCTSLRQGSRFDDPANRRGELTPSSCASRTAHNGGLKATGLCRERWTGVVGTICWVGGEEPTFFRHPWLALALRNSP